MVDGLLPTGLSLFCGAQKIGKSWLMLKLCLCVLEDRLFKLTDTASERLRFAVASCKLMDGHSLTVVVIHHIRKQGDSDIFNLVSGTTGLTSGADATFVLEKEHWASDTAAPRAFREYQTGR